MMIAFVTLVGLLAGWLLNQASNYLPRFSTTPQAVAALPLAPAVWRLLSRTGRREDWFWLHIGVEVSSGVVFAALWAQLGWSWPFALAIAGCAFFLLIAVIDVKHRLVLNVLTYPALAAVLLVHLLILRQNTLSVLLGGILAFSIFFLTAWLKPGDLGFGDVKLAALIGVTFGFPQVLWALMAGAGTGGVVAVYLLTFRRNGMKSQIPYAPFLCLGAVALLLYNVLTWK